MVERSERFASVVQQRDDHIFFVLAVAQRARRRLQTVIAARDVIGRVLAKIAQQSKEPVRQFLERVLVNLFEDLKIFVGALVHPREMHFLHSCEPFPKLGATPASARAKPRRQSGPSKDAKRQWTGAPLEQRLVQRGDRVPQLVEMRDDAIGRKRRDRRVGIAEIDRHRRRSGGAGGVDVGLGIPDHHRAPRVAVRRLDRQPQRARIGLVHGKAAAAANRRESVRRRELLQQQPRQSFRLVGADGEAKAGRLEPIERRERAGEQPAFVGDVRLVINAGSRAPARRCAPDRAARPAGRSRARSAPARPRRQAAVRTRERAASVPRASAAH